MRLVRKNAWALSSVFLLALTYFVLLCCWLLPGFTAEDETVRGVAGRSTFAFMPKTGVL